ncbi:MAG: NAD(P)H-dependent glycerol-3-phosphate dehydrogenase, partial [Oscillospiraceae bacterium]
ISKEIKLTTDISCIKSSEIVIFAIPSTYVRKIALIAKPFMTSKSIIVNTGKGLEDGSLKRLSEVLSEIFPENKVVVLSGPSHAEEVVLCMPTTVVAASGDIAVAEQVQDILANESFRIYTSCDVIGCELGGALKNIIALCAGICDGMGYGDNTKAALMTRGITEIARLGVALGARTDTFAGLTGIGDLIVTCTSMHSRNRRAGILIGQGVSPQEAVSRIGTVEGFYCSKVAHELSKASGVNMPIADELFSVLFENKDVKTALFDLMGRPKRHESEETWAL